MSMEYDRASYMVPLAGTAAGVTMDGTHFTSTIDCDALQATSAAGKALVFVANISAAAAYSAVSWVIQESVDGSTWTAPADPATSIVPLPANLALTSTVFHAGTVSKARYLRAAFNAGGAQTGQITAIVEQLDVVPAFAS